MKEQKPVWDRKKSMVDKNSVCAAVAFFVDSACRGIADRRRAGA